MWTKICFSLIIIFIWFEIFHYFSAKFLFLWSSPLHLAVNVRDLSTLCFTSYTNWSYKYWNESFIFFNKIIFTIVPKFIMVHREEKLKYHFSLFKIYWESFARKLVEKYCWKFLLNWWLKILSDVQFLLKASRWKKIYFQVSLKPLRN